MDTNDNENNWRELLSDKDKEKFKEKGVDLAKKGGVALAEKLNKAIENGNSNIGFLGALVLALIKDFALDSLGQTPVIGWALVLFGGIFIEACLFYFLWGKGSFVKLKLRFFWFIMGFFVDNLPLFSILPIPTVMVLYSWHIVRKRAAKAEEKLKIIHKATDKEIETLNEDISHLDNDDLSNQMKKRNKLRTALERNRRIEDLQEKGGYGNLNTHAGFFESKYNFDSVYDEEYGNETNSSTNINQEYDSYGNKRRNTGEDLIAERLENNYDLSKQWESQAHLNKKDPTKSGGAKNGTPYKGIGGEYDPNAYNALLRKGDRVKLTEDKIKEIEDRDMAYLFPRPEGIVTYTEEGEVSADFGAGIQKLKVRDVNKI